MSLTYDPDAAVAHLTAADKKLAKVIRRAGPFTMRPEKMHDVFHTLLRAIVYQQLSGKAAATILARVLANFPSGARVRPEELLAADETKLRQAGLSHNKLLALRDLAAKTVDGTVPTLGKLKKLSDEEIIARLTQVRGIGVWSVEMLLLFRLGRPDVMPVTDLGIRKGFQLTYGGDELPPPKAILQYSTKWQPYRSVASWYLWRAVDGAKSANGQA